MIRGETFIRVRYAEVDRMGYAYHGHFAEYFEIARGDLVRKLGLSYKEIEDRGILMPVADLHLQYKRPVFYDDELRIVVWVDEMPEKRLTMKCEMYNAEQVAVAAGEVTLAFVDKSSLRPVRTPGWIVNFFQSHWIPSEK